MSVCVCLFVCVFVRLCLYVCVCVYMYIIRTMNILSYYIVDIRCCNISYITTQRGLM